MKRRRRRGGASQGFTMVELLMTMLLMAITLTGLTALQLGVIRQVTISKRANEATRLAQATMDRFRAMAFARLKALETTDWVISTNAQGEDLQNKAADGKRPGPYTVQHLVEDRSPGGLKTRYSIAIRVAWLDVMAGADIDPQQRYRRQTVTMSTQRVEE